MQWYSQETFLPNKLIQTSALFYNFMQISDNSERRNEMKETVKSYDNINREHDGN